MGKRILIVVDMQNDFITGPLGNAETREAASCVAQKIWNEHDSYNRVYFTKDTHHEFYFATLEGERLPVPHCRRNTMGWEHCPEILSAINECLTRVTTVCKNTFGSIELCNLLREVLQDSDDVVEICGVCTDICVVSNALMIRSAFPNNIIRVDSRCCAGTSPEAHKAALMVMKSCQIDIL